MGSYDVACSVSRMTINCGDPVAYFPLEVAKYPYEIEAHNNTLIYPWCYYIPMTLPIFGSYNDYGRIGYVNKKDENIKTIEKYFKCSIDDIADNCRVGKFSSVGMFVHKEIFDCMVENQIDDWGSTKTGKGFGTRSRYFYGKEYDKIRKKLVEDRELDKEIKKLDKKIEKSGTKEDIKLKDDLYLKTLMRNLSRNEDGFLIHREYKKFNEIYKSCIEEGKLKKQLIDMKFFETALFYANVHYFPAANGCQWGNHYGNRIIHQKALDILNEKIAEDEEERAKDE